MFVLPSQAGSTVCRLLGGRQAQLISSPYPAAVVVLGVGKSRGNATAVPGRERNEREVVVVERDNSSSLGGDGGQEQEEVVGLKLFSGTVLTKSGFANLYFWLEL